MITNLAYPVADVLLLALLVAVGAILGVRRDPTLLVLGLGLSFNLVGDVLYLNLTAQGPLRRRAVRSTSPGWPRSP